MIEDTTFPTSTTSQREAQVSRKVHVHAPPSVVFALLADPTEHPGLDGSGTVRAVLAAPDRLELGSAFRMQMKGYSTTNTVVEHEPDAVLAWRHRGRHVWRWELRPVGTGTEVVETFDYSAKRARRLVELFGIPTRAATSIEQTLTGLVARFE